MPFLKECVFIRAGYDSCGLSVGGGARFRVYRCPLVRLTEAVCSECVLTFQSAVHVSTPCLVPGFVSEAGYSGSF